MPVQNKRELLANLYDEARSVERLMGQAVHDALCEHKHAGNPVAVWEDSRVKWIAAEDIILPPETENDATEEGQKHRSS